MAADPANGPLQQDVAPADARDLDWLEDFDLSDPLFEEATSLVRIIDAIMEFFEGVRREYERSVAASQRTRELSARAALQKAKADRDQLNKPATRTAVENARKRLTEIMRDAATGRWREYQLDEVEGIVALAVDPAQPELAGATSAVYSMLALLKRTAEPTSERFRQRIAVWMANVTAQLRSYSYFTQQINRPYLSQKKSAAWTRTCNVTSLAMVLGALGISPDDVDKGRRDSLIKVFAYLEGRTQLTREIWETEVSRLLMPDFLQLVAVDLFLEKLTFDPKSGTVSEQELINRARTAASRAVSSEATIFSELASRFGVQQYRVVPNDKFDSLPSAGREVMARLNEQQLVLRRVLASCLASVSKADDAPTLLSRSLWDIGFRNYRRSEKIGVKLSSDSGPLSEIQQQIVSSIHGVDERRTATFAETRSLINAMTRYAVAFSKKAPKSAHVSGESKRVLNDLDMNAVLELAGKRGLLQQRDGVPRLWSSVAQLFNCHIQGDNGLAELEAAKLDELAGEPRRFVEVVLREWRETERLLEKFRRTSGDDLRKAAETTLRPLLDKGSAIVVLRAGHYVFLVNFDQDEIELNDPASVKSQGSRGRGTRYTWAEASKLAFFRAFHVFFHPSDP